MTDTTATSTQPGTSIEAKRELAIAYLRSRGKYIVEQGCKWRPTSAAATDIRHTINKARKP